MKMKRGRVKKRRFTVDSDSVKMDGSRAIINRIKMIIMLKAIIRYLNFKGYAPVNSYCWNHRRKLALRQQCSRFGGIK